MVIRNELHEYMLTLLALAGTIQDPPLQRSQGDISEAEGRVKEARTI
jgi:hypothetical protein